jgi:hypothetical protein
LQRTNPSASQLRAEFSQTERKEKDKGKEEEGEEKKDEKKEGDIKHSHSCHEQMQGVRVVGREHCS